ncbi:MAG: PD-(D/E)XK nuclease family protein [Chitinispirillia bacterium]|nr:PD-(D/E)XK nuclease family protein [Chitinispirillia bacterium]MCL2267994.1 PD-(D/E)XK nuclease family protein [Chitinispirillia bacterium]
MDNINNLLTDVNRICEKYDEIARISGENFNIFQTLGLQSDELSHSKIIAELINPNGSHDRGHEFLDLFLKVIEEDAQKFKNASVKTEQSTENGRVDILIDAGNQATIVIENKIYAGDQEKQLARYKKSYRNAVIIYLTLSGREPSEWSTDGKEDLNVKSLSYENDIVKWLELCKEKSVNNPYLRETISQYINLLKILTGQTRSKNMSNEIVNTMTQNVKASLAIEENINEMKSQIMFNSFIPAMKKLASKYNLILELDDDSDCLYRYWAFTLTTELLEDNDIAIAFQFLQPNLKFLVCGFHISADNKEIAKNIYMTENPLRKYIMEKVQKRGGPWWLCYNELDWGNNDLENLVSEESSVIVIEKCEREIVDLLDVIKDFNGK